MRPPCTCPPDWRTWAERCAWCQALMERSEAQADAFLAALRQAYPGDDDTRNVDALMREHRHRRRSSVGRLEIAPPQLSLFTQGP